ncbi:zinc finger BED domain-containing protein DAYSLEEPER-like [Quercus lobata]|uniref:zinc finger BED domain-containing protein DAYSLEEPER-like n=1 Tax=Quercus lobata TaxID=97700 RepID=UPI00124819FF|nr:zinc finger BED domain-containing protein DAYSLEEPER-like [Quercus lobata]
MALARMIIVDKLPFRFVEHGGFIDFMTEIKPRFEVPSCVTVARDCLSLYIREKESLRKVSMAGQRVCLTTDTWTSIQNLNYLCLTAHYIDVDWVYHKKILNLCQLPDHKGETIDGLKDLNESIVKVCYVVRWNSTYLMLESAQKFVATFERMEDDDGNFLRYFEDPTSGPPRFLDWENVRLFTKFLGMFYEATLRFSGSLFVTTNVYFHELVSLQDQLNQLRNGRGDPLLKGMAQKNEIRQWYHKEKANELGLRVRDALNRLYKHYSGAMGTPCGASVSGTSESGGSDVAAISSILSGFSSAKERMKRYNNIYKQHLADEDSVECKFELDRYLLEASVDSETEGFDILDWLWVNFSRYRILSQVSCNVLTIPVSTVASLAQGITLWILSAAHYLTIRLEL